MSDDSAHTRPIDMYETYCTPSAPSRRGVLAAGAGFAGIATAQLFAAQTVAARTSATLDQLKRAERDAAHRVLLKGGIVLSLDPQSAISRMAMS